MLNKKFGMHAALISDNMWHLYIH